MLEASARFVPEHIRQLDGVQDFLSEVQAIIDQAIEISQRSWHRFPALGQPAYLLTQAQIDQAIDDGLTSIRVDFPPGSVPYVPGADMLFVDLGGLANQDPGDAYMEDGSGLAIHLLLYDQEGDLQLYEGQKVRVRWYS